MKNLFVSLAIVAGILKVEAQKTQWSTEFQTSFIDISGLFGLDQPAQVTAMKYQKRHIFLDGFHSFSWQEPGKTIQTFFSGGYQFEKDSLHHTSFSVGNGFAFNRVADNGSFLRPVVTFSTSPNEAHSISFVAWLFLDTRGEVVQPLNGGTMYLAHIFSKLLPGIQVRNEVRLLYSHIEEIRSVGGITDQLKVTHMKSGSFLVANTGYSFYRSDHKTEFIYNLGLGLRF